MNKGRNDREGKVAWIFPYKIEVEIHKEGKHYIYDYKEHVKPLPEDRYGKDDTQELMDKGYIAVPGCEVLKFESSGEMCHAVLKTDNMNRIIIHLINEIEAIGRKPSIEKDVLPEVLEGKEES